MMRGLLKALLNYCINMNDKEPKEWTKARVDAFAVSSLRAGFRRFPTKWEVNAEGKMGKHVNKYSGRMAEHYLCASCGGLFIARDVQVDHIDPVVDPVVGFVNLDTFSDRLHCPKDNMQLLCKPCHKEKTNVERKERKKK
jgi:5-methylcytosine-specific restriction endonuclease McrA